MCRYYKKLLKRTTKKVYDYYEVFNHLISINRYLLPVCYRPTYFICMIHVHDSPYNVLV